MNEQTQQELNELDNIRNQPVSPALANYPRSVKMAMLGASEHIAGDTTPAPQPQTQVQLRG
jgi:hypothetical protein